MVKSILTRKALAVMLASLFICSALVGCSSGGYKADVMENDVTLQKGDTVAVINIKDYGEVKVKLFPDIAPKAVENFVTHSKNGYYDGLTFHRVIKDFMVQGGDPSGTGGGGGSIWGQGFENEISDKARHFNGALSMANTGQPNTNGSQFFLVNSDVVEAEFLKEYLEGISEDDIKIYGERGGAAHLDGLHTVFGMTYSGMDVIADIANTEVDPSTNKPIKPVIIKSVKIYTVE